MLVFFTLELQVILKPAHLQLRLNPFTPNSHVIEYIYKSAP